MKVFFSIFLVACSLFATEQKIQKATELEMFLFKIGFTSLLTDFENEKNITKTNTTDIKELKANIKYILQDMNKNKIEGENYQSLKQNNNIIPINNSKNDNLTKEIKYLKNEINKLKVYINKQNINLSKKISFKKNIKNKVVINSKKASARNAPSSNAKIIKQFFFGETILIEYCDKYGWCKISNKNLYIPEFLLKK